MVKTVVLDAGHGLPDPGAVKFGQEYKYALDIVREIANRLPDGIKTVLTRTTDKALNDSKSADLKKRCDISNGANADLFVSIHLNASGGVGTGYETLVYSPNNQGTILHNEVKQVLSAYGVKDRGIKTRPDLYVLKHTRATALLLEIAFIDNKADMDLVNNQTYYNALCQSIADGIAKALGIDPKVTKTEVKPEVKSAENKGPDYIGHEFEASIKKAIAKKIINGYDANIFKPNEPLTRGQLAVILDRLGLLN